jgi:alkanesulfonate monooxygenase SsuD/methylene tetrahydromethanopterin reductase-like flavin-dependent oxidoreductase (luciferase family)
MRFGLALDFGTMRASLDQVIEEYLPVIRLAERYGFDAVVAGETYPGAPGFFHISSPFLVLASLAPRTSLRLGTGVTLLPAWPPLKLAFDCAILDQISGGRFVLGIGVANPGDWQRFGKDRGQAAQYMDETLQALRALWRGEKGFQGDLVSIDQAILPLPVRPGGPPILVGGLIPRAARRAAAYADGWYAATPYRLSDIRRQTERYREALKEGGQDPQGGIVAANRLTFLAETEAGLEAGRPGVNTILKSYARFGGLLAAGDQPPAQAERLKVDAPDLLERARDEICLYGTPDQVIAQVQRYADAGVTEIQMRVAPGDMPIDLVAQTVTLAGERVLPRFR